MPKSKKKKQLSDDDEEERIKPAKKRAKVGPNSVFSLFLCLFTALLALVVIVRLLWEMTRKSRNEALTAFPLPVSFFCCFSSCRKLLLLPLPQLLFCQNRTTGLCLLFCLFVLLLCVLCLNSNLSEFSVLFLCSYVLGVVFIVSSEWFASSC